jgi:rod shape-determining protein MreD
MELVGIGPDWLLIWVASWSLHRPVLQAILAGLVLGLIQDGMTATYPSHVFSLVLVGFLCAKRQKQGYGKHNFITVILVVFGMAGVAETITALQYALEGLRPLADIWRDYQRIALSSAILSSLWSPVLYYPLKQWWERDRKRRSLLSSRIGAAHSSVKNF